MVYPGELDIVILQGATFRRSFVWKSGPLQEPVNLAGAEIRMQIRYAKPDDQVLMEASTDNGLIVIEDAENGAFAIDIPGETTAEYDFLTGVYDIEVKVSSGEIYRLIEGRMKLSQEVTR